jgi:hypothetical protein
MSREPLQHELADDLESFLHVLGWVALRFTRHSMTPKALTSLLNNMFDDSYSEDDGYARGGSTKESYLVSGKMTKNAGFSDSILTALIKDVTDTCAVRYIDPPSDDELAEYHKMQKEQPEYLNSTVWLHTAAKRYERDFEALSSSTWMLKRFEDSAVKLSMLPGTGPSKANPLSFDTPASRKRKSSESDALVKAMPKQKKRFPIAREEETNEDDTEEM